MFKQKIYNLVYNQYATWKYTIKYVCVCVCVGGGGGEHNVLDDSQSTEFCWRYINW